MSYIHLCWLTDSPVGRGSNYFLLLTNSGTYLKKIYRFKNMTAEKLWFAVSTWKNSCSHQIHTRKLFTVKGNLLRALECTYHY